MRQGDQIKIHHPWTNIVTVKGNSPWVPAPNDGVVTVASQNHHNEGMELIELDYNHYEVVLSERTVNIINERIVQCSAKC